MQWPDRSSDQSDTFSNIRTATLGIYCVGAISFRVLQRSTDISLHIAARETRYYTKKSDKNHSTDAETHMQLLYWRCSLESLGEQTRIIRNILQDNCHP